MISSSDQKLRRVVPRWRSYSITASLGELDGRGSPKGELPSTQQALAQSVDYFNASPSISSAADVLNRSIVAGDRSKAVPAAKFLLEDDTSAVDGLKRFAKLVVDGSIAPILASDREKIRQMRTRLKLHPRDAIGWVELGLTYIRSAEPRPDKAARSLEVALGVKPNDRYVLRSAACFYASQGINDRAYDIVARSARTEHDPWLSAAEVALSGAAGRSSKISKRAMSAVEGLPRPDIGSSELLSALATLDLENGTLKRAKKRFRASLPSGSDNALAQAQWASEAHNVQLPLGNVDGRYTSEAAARYCFSLEDWPGSIRHILAWVEDQPFDPRAAHLGLLISSSLLQDAVAAEHFAHAGLRFWPKNSTFLNNAAVAFARDGQVERAQNYLDQARAATDKSDVASHIIYEATSGLISFRSERVVEGAARYKRAIDLAVTNRYMILASRASLYLVAELARAVPGLTDQARKIVGDLQKKLPANDSSFFAKECHAVQQRLTAVIAKGGSGEEPQFAPSPEDIDQAVREAVARVTNRNPWS